MYFHSEIIFEIVNFLNCLNTIQFDNDKNFFNNFLFLI